MLSSRGAVTAPKRCRRRFLGPGICALASVCGIAVALSACGGASPAAAPSTSTTRPGPSETTTTKPASAMTFSAPHPVSTSGDLVAISCVLRSACLALDAKGDAYAYDGSRWAGPVAPGTAAGSGATSVSCVDATACWADPTGGDQLVEWDGTAWSAPSTLTAAHSLEAVGCAPDGYCAAVDALGDSFDLVDGSWQPTDGDWGAVSSISCVDPTFCVSASGGLSEWSGTGWSVPEPMGATTPFTGVSCASASFCMAVDAGGQALQWNGSGWSEPAPVAAGTPTGGTAPDLTAVACASASFCVAGDSSGQLFAWADGAWAELAGQGAGPLTSISCPASSFCAAADGDAVRYGTAP